jgi:hypothetical protein
MEVSFYEFKMKGSMVKKGGFAFPNYLAVSTDPVKITLIAMLIFFNNEFLR